jgi:hypothetical protein
MPRRICSIRKKRGGPQPMSDEPKPGADIVADARKRLANRAGRESTHSKYCHEWHDTCLIARLVDECERLRDDWPDQLKSAHSEIDRLREANATLTDAEREFLQALRDAYQEMANQTGSVNAAVQADSRKNAAIIRGLLERTK